MRNVHFRFPPQAQNVACLSSLIIYIQTYIFFLLLIFFRERMAALVLGVIKELEDKRFVDTVAAARVV